MLAKVLHPDKQVQIRIEDKNKRGVYTSQLQPLFERYLAPENDIHDTPNTGATSATSDTGRETNDNQENSSATDPLQPATEGVALAIKEATAEACSGSEDARSPPNFENATENLQTRSASSENVADVAGVAEGSGHSPDIHFASHPPAAPVSQPKVGKSRRANGQAASAEDVWRPVRPDEVLPPGCSVRLNMTTGLNQVRGRSMGNADGEFTSVVPPATGDASLPGADEELI
jgi:hypothetical protein